MVKELVKSMARKALGDLKSAEVLLEAGRYPEAVLHSQQAVEKMMKALLLIKGVALDSHRITSEFKDRFVILASKKWENKLKRAAMLGFELEDHWLIPRYPLEGPEGVIDPEEKYTKDLAEELFNKASEAMEILCSFSKEELGLELCKEKAH